MGWALRSGHRDGTFPVLPSAPMDLSTIAQFVARRSHLWGCYGLTGLLYKGYDALPQLMLGRILPPSAVGLYNRASVICGIPERLVLSQVSAVAFPVFAAKLREGDRIKDPYLAAISHLTVVHWPALIVLALLAYPAVVFVVGRQWTDIVPLVRIMCIAGLFWSPVIPTHQVLTAFGPKHNLLPSLIARPIAALVLCFASVFGLTALAASQVVTSPFQLYVALRSIRHHIPFRWGELVAAMWKSAVVMAFTAAGPAALITLAGFRSDLSIGAALIAGLLSTCCWVGGLWLTRHPLLLVIQMMLGAIEPSSLAQRLVGVGSRLRNRYAAVLSRYQAVGPVQTRRRRLWSYVRPVECRRS